MGYNSPNLVTLVERQSHRAAEPWPFLLFITLEVVHSKVSRQRKIRFHDPLQDGGNMLQIEGRPVRASEMCGLAEYKNKK
jgi:hypothetical protein